jgi:DNA repair protein RecN (Recombination protein N)
LLEEYRGMFRQWSILQKEWALLRDQQGQWEKESDYRRFLFEELSTAAFREHELEDLDSELQRLNHAETIQEKLAQASADLQDGERPAIQLIRSAIGQLNALQRFHPGLSDLAGRMRSAQLELEDIYSELGRIRQDSEQDPGRIEQLNERMALGYRLLKKHGVRETSDLLAIQHDLESKLRATLDLSNLLDAKAKQAGLVKEELERVAAQLSRNRLEQVNLLEQNVNRLLSQVGMPNARLQVAVRPITMQESGTDNAEFLFDANRSNRFEPVGKVASGGELSRLMLCIKSLVAQSMDLPTMVFDEIDAGISGEAARQVANILYGISRTRQVICITHQAQIAGKADAHFLVFKESAGGPAVTRIRLLKKDERVTAIAQMLGGEKPTAAALANAKEMMMQ